MKSWAIVITCLLLKATGCFSQCFTSNTAFQTGERITYEILYNWGFIWIGAGNVVFTVNQAEYQGRQVYLLDAHGSSFSSFDWFYKVRDSFQSYLDKETLQPLWHLRNTSEGSYSAYEEYFFDYGKSRIYSASQATRKSYRKDTLEILPVRSTW